MRAALTTKEMKYGTARGLKKYWDIYRTSPNVFVLYFNVIMTVDIHCTDMPNRTKHGFYTPLDLMTARRYVRMDTQMQYVVALDDGELVKMTIDGFESTGMFLIPVDDAPISQRTLLNYIWVSSYA